MAHFSICWVPVLVTGHFFKFFEQLLGLYIDLQNAAVFPRGCRLVTWRTGTCILLDSSGKGWMYLHRGHPAFFESSIDQSVCILRINLPEATFSRFIFLSWYLDEALIQGQVVPNGILKFKRQSLIWVALERVLICRASLSTDMNEVEYRPFRITMFCSKRKLEHWNGLQAKTDLVCQLTTILLIPNYKDLKIIVFKIKQHIF